MKKKKIAHVINLTGVGGVQQMFVPYYEMACQASAYAHAVYGACPQDPRYARVHPYKYVYKSPLYLIELAMACLSSESLVLFHNMLGGNMIRHTLRYVPQARVIFSEHGAIWSAKGKVLDAYRENAKRAHCIIVNSQAARIMLREKAQIPDQRIHVVHNGFIHKNFIQPRAYAQKRKKRIVGYIGRLVEFKGVQTLIRAAHLLRHEDIEFRIAGTGYYERRLKELAHGNENVCFTGFVSDPVNFIKELDILVVPSVREPLGNIIIEAGFCQVPVIASNIDGIPEIITHGVNGWLLSPRKPFISDNSLMFPDAVVDPAGKRLQVPKELDERELADCILRIGADTDLQRKMGRALYETVQKEFSLEKYFSLLEEIFNSLFRENISV